MADDRGKLPNLNGNKINVNHNDHHINDLQKYSHFYLTIRLVVDNIINYSHIT